MTKHRFRVVPTFFALALIALPIGAAWVLIEDARADRPVDELALLVGLLAGLFVCLIGAWLLQWIMDTRVREDGIRAWNIWNLRRRMSWDEIAECRAVKLPLWPFVRILSKNGGSAIWQPLFLQDGMAFRDAVRGHAGEEHVLVQFLSGYFGASDAAEEGQGRSGV